MAVAGLHNLTVFDPSSGDGQHSPSPSSTRASTLLQIWREIEAEHVVSHSRQQRNGLDSISQGSDDDTSQDFDLSEYRGSVGLGMEHEDSTGGSPISEQPGDLGEVERGRVRQIFREWKSSGINNCSSSGQWLGENECERVRIIREWMQRNSCGSSRRDGITEIGSRIDQVRNGLVISHPDTGARRPVRRLCGRQTLLDLLVRAQSERKTELLGLAEHRPVSGFAHRNRIQGLLRGRFLRNERLGLDERPSSVATTELNLLRQRQTVSDLREGFLSRLDSPASASVNCADSDSTHSSESNGESESKCAMDGCGIQAASNSESAAEQSSSLPEFDVQITESEDRILDTEVTEQVALHSVGSSTSREELRLDTEAGLEATFNHNSLLESEVTQSCRPPEVHDENNDQRSGRVIDDMEVNTNGELDSEDVSALPDFVQELVIETEDETTTTRSWQEGPADQWSPETSHNNNVEEQDQMQESRVEVWPSHNLQDAIDSWLDMPSGEVIGDSIERTNAFYFSDDDNVHSMEIRELSSRQRVSSLLRSGFRDSLNRVLQSHVERLGQASSDWEDDNTSPDLVEQEQEQLNGDQNSVNSDGDESNPFAPSTLFASPHPLWDVELQTVNWPHHISNQQMGTEWEVINELRIDMARLQHRMNDMQRMLEACMEMQIELQRSVRQEVAAALNSSRVTDKSLADQHHGESEKWDSVRKGICCLCRGSKIDSLLYRCGHMCTCSKCAESLIEHKGKCPMCLAPVVEVVRAYFVQ